MATRYHVHIDPRPNEANYPEDIESGMMEVIKDLLWSQATESEIDFITSSPGGPPYRVPPPRRSGPQPIDLVWINGNLDRLRRYATKLFHNNLEHIDRSRRWRRAP